MARDISIAISAKDNFSSAIATMVSDGLVPGEEAAKAIADYMGYDFAGNMDKQSQTYSGLVSTLQDSQTALDNAMGEGYNSTRKTGLQDQIDWLSGGSGKSMQDAYDKIGQWKASLENLSEKYQRDALKAVMNGTVNTQFSPETLDRFATMYDEYTKYAADGSEEAGAKMGELLAEAQAIAQNEYNATEGAQLALESNKSLAENIKNDSASQDAYWDAGYTMGQEFTKGLASAMTKADEMPDYSKKYMETNNIGMGGSYGETISTEEALERQHNSELTPTQKQLLENNIGLVNASSQANGHAYGLNYVPYNNYPALLHEGERVLTASENRSHSTGTPVTITGNNFVVRSESDIKSIAQAIARQINRAFILAPQ